MTPFEKWQSLAGDPREGPDGWYDRAGNVPRFDKNFDYFGNTPLTRPLDAPSAEPIEPLDDPPPAEPEPIDDPPAEPELPGPSQ